MSRKNQLLQELADKDIEHALLSSEESDSETSDDDDDDLQTTINKKLDQIGQIWSTEDCNYLLNTSSGPTPACGDNISPPSLPLTSIYEPSGPVNEHEQPIPSTSNADTSLSCHLIPEAVNYSHIYKDLHNKPRHWTSEVSDIPNIDFDEKVIKHMKSYTHLSPPIKYFDNVFPDCLMHIIVNNTNIYAAQKKTKNWVPITKDELRAYLGIIILMGLLPLTEVDLYWSTDRFYNNSEICEVMPLKRFKKISQNLHVSNNAQQIPRGEAGHDKLFKVRSMINILNESFSQNATESSHQSIDESMIKFSGRSVLVQFMPQKPIRKGYKAWAKCDAKTGYLYQFRVYTGKSDASEPDNSALGFRVVADLCENTPPNTLVTFDNFFSSLAIMEYLYQKQIYSIATFRANRKGIPPELLEKKPVRERLQQGEFMYKHSSPISVIRWKDSKDVFVMTTAYNPRDVVTIQRRQKDGSRKPLSCPLPIVKYTKYMGGVDHYDHLRSSYAIGRKSKKNWLRIFWFMFEAAVINAYILYALGHDSRINTHKKFRLRLARSLINGYSNRTKKQTVFRNKSGSYGVLDEVRLANVGYHFFEKSSFKRCKYCSTKKAEKRSKYICKICKVPLCVTPCFELFHK